MEDREQKRQELLQDLARRFKNSAGNLKDIARRIDAAARTHDEIRNRIDEAGKHLRDCIESDPSTMPFTYLEYLEFDTAKEFDKFKSMAVITEDEIKSVDWDDLSSKLLQA